MLRAGKFFFTESFVLQMKPLFTFLGWMSWLRPEKGQRTAAQQAHSLPPVTQKLPLNLARQSR